MAIRILGSVLILFVAVALGLSESVPGVLKRGPSDCSEVYQSGNYFEGYYAIFPNPKNLDEAGLVYCSVDDGMLPYNSSTLKANARNCKDLLDNGMTDSGINVIYPLVDHPESPVIVYCDQTTSGGGWTVFQRRDDFESQISFFKSFDDYGAGFGNVGMEVWLGLDIIHALTNQAVSELYVDLYDFNDVNKYAHYKSFFVGPRDPDANTYSYGYELAISQYSGTAGDGLANDNGMGFTTYDHDVDTCSGHCADSSNRMAGWWYKCCGYSNLNGPYSDSEVNSANSLNWYHFANDWRSLRKTTMMTRPLQQQ